MLLAAQKRAVGLFAAAAFILFRGIAYGAIHDLLIGDINIAFKILSH